jgi:hypothetical protein
MQWPHDLWMAVELMDDSVGIKEVVHGCSRGSGHVEIKQSAEAYPIDELRLVSNPDLFHSTQGGLHLC